MLPELWFWANADVKLQIAWKQILIYLLCSTYKLLTPLFALIVVAGKSFISSLRRRQQVRTAVCPSHCLGYSQFCCFSCFLNAIAERVNAVCVTQTSANEFWLLRDFGEPSEDVKLSDGPNYLLILLYYKVIIITIITTVYCVLWD